jgi:hypothetical protein
VGGGEYVLNSNSLTRHCVVFGATGSGKTVLSKSIVEAAALAGVPVLAIDPKGDIGSLAVRPGGLDSGSYIEEIQRSGHNELEVARFNENVEVRIFTPRSGMGIPVSLSPKLEAPGNFQTIMAEDPPLAYEMLEITSSTIGKLVGFDEDEKVKLAFIAAILEHYWTHGRAVEIRDLVEGVRNPPFEKFGELKTEDVFDRKERAELITRMNLLLTDPGIKSWFIGEPIDFDRWFMTDAKTPINVVDLRGVAGEAERQVFVEYLLEQLFFWMIRQKGSQALKYLLYFDEIHGFCPPVRAPASKKILIRLVKMARSFGLGMVLATQNPSDLDYKVLSNANIRFIGSLPMKQDIERIRLGLDLGADALDTLSSLRKMEFYCQIFDKNEGFLTVPGRLISQHSGPLELNDVRKLMQPLKEEWIVEEPTHPAAGVREFGNLDNSRDLKVVPNSLPLKVDIEKASKQPLDGPVSLKRLKLKFDPYYVIDYDVNTWKQFPHYQKEVRINGKGTILVDAANGKIVKFLPSGEHLTHIPIGGEKLSASLTKTLISGELGMVDVPSHDNLTTESLEKVKDERQIELKMKQYVSDFYEKRVKLVGVRTTREASVKPSARDIHFENTRLVRHPVWTATFGIDGTEESFRRIISGADGTILAMEYPICSAKLHGILLGSVSATACGHAACSKHLHACLTCMKNYCETCRPKLSCGHVACNEHTANCSLGTEQVCMKCGLNSCTHYTCESHRRDCEHCGKTVCFKCTVEKGMLRKRYACSEECASFL